MSELGWVSVSAQILVEVAMDDQAETSAEAVVLAALQTDPQIKQATVMREVRLL